ncbi:MAG: precorrin-2 C(20)-methyltransferase [Candidatus Nezhaarchaeota archaeon]|nr:precorrin-2 C(20)-methyltransferase [Candidatus Nezhaarchaeota archaeon]
MLGKLYGVGVGPGDPDLLTLKAVKVLGDVDVIFAPKPSTDKPSLALTIVKPMLRDHQEVVELVYPMTKEREVLEACWEKNADLIISKLMTGKNAAFITLGDPMLYSTFIYTCRKIVAKAPDVEIEIVPGVTSITECAAISRTSIAEGDEVVVIIPSLSDREKIRGLAKYADTLIFMKELADTSLIVETLIESGFNQETPVVIVKAYGGLKRKEVFIERLVTLTQLNFKDTYFSMLMVKRVKK